MELSVVTAPTIPPLSLDDAKDHLRIVHTDDDLVVQRCLQVAEELLQQETGLQLAEAEYDWVFDDFPASSDPLYVPRSPLASITSIKYQDTADQEQTLGAANYFADTSKLPHRICLIYGESWPDVLSREASVTVRYKAGWSNQADIPQRAKQALRIWLASLYEHRDVVEHIESGRAVRTGQALEALVNSLKIPRFV